MADELTFDWDEANIRHISDHDVAPEEAEQALANDPLELEPEYIRGEERFPSIGRTDAGRWLVVITTLRGPKVRVVTAFDAGKRSIDVYLKEKGTSE